MLKLGNKNKKLLFEVATKGVQSKDLKFWLRIMDENVSLGFEGKLLETGKLQFNIPPLDTILQNVENSKKFQAQVEIIGEDKFYMKTWDGELLFEQKPQISVKLEDSHNPAEEEIENEDADDKKLEEASTHLIFEEDESEDDKNENDGEDEDLKESYRPEKGVSSILDEILSRKR